MTCKLSIYIQICGPEAEHPGSHDEQGLHWLYQSVMPNCVINTAGSLKQGRHMLLVLTDFLTFTS